VTKFRIRDGQVDSGSSRASSWGTIHCIRCEIEFGEEMWFGDNILRMVGDGERTLFWNDSWVDGISLKSRFSILFELSLDQDKMVADMFKLGWGYGRNSWRWRRRLFTWNEELCGECCAVLANVFYSRLIFLVSGNECQILM
jgi:hypothetical protein